MSKVLQVCAIMQKHFQMDSRHTFIRSPSLFLQNHGYKALTATNPVYAEEPRFLESSSFLMDELKKLDFMPSIWDRFKEVIEYNVLQPSGRLRSVSMLYMYRKLKNNYKDFTEDEDIQKLYIMAWCMDILKAWSCPWDDYVDNCRWRRGRETWAFHQSNPLIAIYDLDFIRESIYKLIYVHFDDDKEQCLELFKIFQTSVFGLIIEEELNMMNKAHVQTHRGNPGALEFQQWHMTDQIVHYALKEYTFTLPFLITLTLARQRNDKLEKIVSEVHENLARIYKEFDDLADLYVDPTLDGKKPEGFDKGDGATGKENTDMSNGDFNVVLLGALEIASPEQKKVLELNWGMKGDKHEQAIRKVFSDLDMEKRTKQKIADLLEIVKKQIEGIPNDVIRETNYHLLDALLVKNDENYCRS